LWFTHSTFECKAASRNGRLVISLQNVGIYPALQPKNPTMTTLLIALMLGAVSTTETQVNFYQTARRNIQDDSHNKI
jgi:hypothetical protein